MIAVLVTRSAGRVDVTRGSQQLIGPEGINDVEAILAMATLATRGPRERRSKPTTTLCSPWNYVTVTFRHKWAEADLSKRLRSNRTVN
jgi:hypothetical protein